jgi:phosphatidylglycerophosphatase A
VFVFIPASASTAVAAFFLFRLFDIWKPWPINRIEKRLQNGLGVMLDDLLAASYTVLTIVLAHRLFGWS